MPEKLFSSAGWQPARRDVAKEFVSSAGWQPAEALDVPEKLFSSAGWQPARRDVAKEFVSSAGWQPAELFGLAGLMWRKSSFRLRAGSPQRRIMCRKSSFRLRAGSPHGVMWRKSSFRLRAGSPQRPYVPEKLFSSAGWQPARRDVAKEFVSSAGWQPAEALCAGKALFVCGLAARTAWKEFDRGERVRFACGLRAGSPQRPWMCRKSSFRLRAGSPHGVMWRKSSFRLRAGSPQRRKIRFVCGLAARRGLYVPEKLFSSAGWQPADMCRNVFSLRCWREKFVSSVGWQPAEALCAGKALFVCGLAARTA